MIHSTSGWFLISALLALISIGFGGIVKIAACVGLVAVGALAVAYIIAGRNDGGNDDRVFSTQNCDERQSWSPHRPTTYGLTPDPVTPSGARLTGVPQLDDEVNEILAFVFRDQILPWQTQLTHTNVFTLRVQDGIRAGIAEFSERVRQVDWIPFLTTRLVNTVVSHLRLFKQARLRQRCSNSSKASELESAFFDCEVEDGGVCRDLVSTTHQDEVSYLQDVTELLLFLLLPQTDFGCQSLRTVTREVLVNTVIKPSLDMLSDPDFINQTIVWLYQDYQTNTDLFLLTVRLSESLEELQATRDMSTREINLLRQNDSKSEADSSLKQQLNSLLHLRKSIDARIHRLQSGSETDSIGVPVQIDWNQMIGPGLKLFSLPMDVVMKNNLALSYFIDYMTSISCQAYIFFYLNVEGWKVSAEQHLMSVFEAEEQQRLKEESERQSLGSMGKDSKLENLREGAHSIYSDYLSENAKPRLRLDDAGQSAVTRLILKIRSQDPEPDWFGEVQECVYSKLQGDERFFESFKKSMGYVKLLAELDLLKDPSTKGAEEDDNVSIDDEFSIYDNASINSYEEEDVVARQSRGSSAGAELSEASNGLDLDATITNSSGGDSGIGGSIKSHKRVGSESLLLLRGQNSLELPTPRRGYGHARNPSQGSVGSNEGSSSPSLALSAAVTEVAMKSDSKGSSKTYAVYAVVVRAREDGGVERTEWRRYSEFYALNELVGHLFPGLRAQLVFPSKKTFGNTQKDVLEKRRGLLHVYLQELLRPETLQTYNGLFEHLRRFLDPSVDEKDRVCCDYGKTPNVAVKAVKSVGHAAIAAPGAIIHTVGNVVGDVVDGTLGKAFSSNHRIPIIGIDNHPSRYAVDPFNAASSGVVVGAGANVTDSVESNIPLRIILLLMDEVFDLRERNQWLRKNIVLALKQILKAMFGDIVNRRIVEYFAAWTSPETLSSYFRALKDSLWPSGFPAETVPPRDEATKMRTRIAAKMAMFSSLSDDLKRVIGSDTSRAGLMTLFDMLQHPVLNKRLTVVLLEAVLDTVFGEQDLPAIFQKLHSRSGRLKNELRNSQRKHSDLRVNR